MKSILLSLLFAWTAAAQPTLKVGSDVNLAPLAAADWLQGSAPASFEPGKGSAFETQ